MQSLHATETWMLSVITHPHGLSAGTDTCTSEMEIDLIANQLNQVIRATPKWSAANRLGIYWNAYFSRLQECLRDEYPVLRGSVGDDVFDQFVHEYLQAHPPSSYTLGQLGANFPKFLAATRPSRDGDGAVPDWADFIADLASLEWTIAEVFDGPGVEGMLPPPPFELAATDQVGDATFLFAPCLKLCEYQFPVHTYHAAYKASEQADFPDAQPSFVAVTRQDFAVKLYTLSTIEYSLLKFLQDGHSLAEALDCTLCANESTATNLNNKIARWFSDWTRSGFIQRIVFPIS